MEVADKELTQEETQELLEFLLTSNNLEFNTLKVIEEIFETGELLTKSISKVERLKPTKEQLVEEIGDLLMRLKVLILHMKIDEDVERRMENKFAALHEWMKQGNLGSTVTVTKQGK